MNPLLLSTLIFISATSLQDPVFSGPQPGEKLTPFTVRGIYEPMAGKEFDLVTETAGKPLLLVFVHEANRPSVALTRVLMADAVKRAGRGLRAGVVWLTDDPTSTEQFLQRARHPIPTDVPIGLSLDGVEGPGTYGLNRNVTLTILLAKDNQVVASFALIQPSLQADGPKVFQAVNELVGGGIPNVDEFSLPEMRRQPSPSTPEDPKLTKSRFITHRS